jgi:hypothetical protein
MRVNKVNLSENGLTTTYKSNGDDLSMSMPAGEGYTAKLDGKDYPYKGAFSYDAVSLKRINDRTFEETDKLNGKVMQVSKMTVSSDGKTITVVSTYVPTNRTSTYVGTKQQVWDSPAASNIPENTPSLSLRFLERQGGLFDLPRC